MAIQRHPVDSFDKKRNFWEEFPDYKVNRMFGTFWALNKKNNLLKNSSLFMWLLTLCYDRKSVFFPQPDQDKWEVVGEDLFGDSEIMQKLTEDPLKVDAVYLPKDTTVFDMILEFEKTIDTPLGLSLRILEKKLAERTQFIQDTKYTMDEYKKVGNRQVLIKGSASQLDKMFADTDKITSLIQNAIDNLRSSQAVTETKGGQKESLTDGAKDF